MSTDGRKRPKKPFRDMKKLIIGLPLLTTPQPKETLYVYRAAAKEVGSTMLASEVAPEKDNTKAWTPYTDGASNLKGSRANLVLIGPSGVEYTYALRLNFVNTNNEAKYEALLAGLRIAKRMKVQSLEAKVDSKLVASQINESYVASNNSMVRYLAKANEHIACFKSFSIKNILRNQNC
ncbi:reverse transcriptase domain-containing protein [Tanacetum coccineum]|uniref:Reverse transcriptase domain-containing protein n=1 Tax=Tanacetum coccineum TaxID=301880 RepID=A0ABQ5A8Y8_9ASTR